MGPTRAFYYDLTDFSHAQPVAQSTSIATSNYESVEKCQSASNVHLPSSYTSKNSQNGVNLCLAPLARQARPGATCDEFGGREDATVC